MTTISVSISISISISLLLSPPLPSSPPPRQALTQMTTPPTQLPPPHLKPQSTSRRTGKSGLPSADRNYKATLLLTGPVHSYQSSARALSRAVLSPKLCRSIRIRVPPASGMDSDLEAFSHYPAFVASRHCPLGQPQIPIKRMSCSSRTKLNYHCGDSSVG